MHKITEVKVLEDYKLDLTFADGTQGTVDLSRLVGKGVFAVGKNRGWVLQCEKQGLGLAMQHARSSHDPVSCCASRQLTVE